jgi:hypothetical protein
VTTPQVTLANLGALRRDVAALVAGAPSLAATYAYEPRSETSSPYATVQVETVTPTEVEVVVRVYVRYGDSIAEDAESQRETAVAEVDSLLDTNSRFGPSQWTFGVLDDLSALVARCSLLVGREDF